MMLWERFFAAVRFENWPGMLGPAGLAAAATPIAGMATQLYSLARGGVVRRWHNLPASSTLDWTVKTVAISIYASVSRCFEFRARSVRCPVALN